MISFLSWQEVRAALASSVSCMQTYPQFVAIKYQLLHPDGEFHCYFVARGNDATVINLQFCSGSLSEVLCAEALMNQFCDELLTWYPELTQLRFIDIRNEISADLEDTFNHGLSEDSKVVHWDWQILETVPVYDILRSLMPMFEPMSIMQGVEKVTPFTSSPLKPTEAPIVLIIIK